MVSERIMLSESKPDSKSQDFCFVSYVEAKGNQEKIKINKRKERGGSVI